jgi:hypothetical protein
MSHENYEKEEWYVLYRDAILELEHARITGRIADTRTAVIARLEKLKDMPRFQTEECEAIDDALRGLKVLEREEAAYQAEEKQSIVERALANLRSLAPAL